VNHLRHLVRLLGRGISPSQCLYLHRTTQRRKTRTNIHASSGIRTHVLHVGAIKDRAGLRSRSHCDYCYYYYHHRRHVYFLLPLADTQHLHLIDFHEILLKPPQSTDRTAEGFVYFLLISYLCSVFYHIISPHLRHIFLTSSVTFPFTTGFLHHLRFTLFATFPLYGLCGMVYLPLPILLPIACRPQTDPFCHPRSFRPTAVQREKSLKHLFSHVQAIN
jgi:hypothetical protein